MKKLMMVIILITGLTFYWQLTLNATILTFNLNDYYSAIPASYGDNVSVTNDGVGNYEEGNGWTSNVTVDYRSFNTNYTDENMYYWEDGYGDLIDAAYSGYWDGTAEITLTAHNGHEVTLNQFDLGGWYMTDRLASHLRILDGNDNILELLDDMTIEGTNGHTTIVGPWTSSIIKIQFGNDYNIGIDNIDFDEFQSAPDISAVVVNVDIKPGSCPNPFNVKSKGKLPVAILGSVDFDVRTIDVDTITLNGVAPVKSSYGDVTAPAFKIDDCDCEALGPDSFEDLGLKFNTQEIVNSLGDVNDGDNVTLTLTGNLNEADGGTAIEGLDCVLILDKGKGKRAK